MNRDANGEGESLSRQQQGPSSSYLAYLLLLSVGMIVVLPHMFPSRSLLSWSGSEREEDTGGSGRSSLRSERRSSSKQKASAPMPLYDRRSPMYDSYDSKCASLETLVMDLQRVVHVERERTMHLENEIRVMQMSEHFLKDRVQYLEERNLVFRREGLSSSPSTSSTSSPSMDSLFRSPQFSASDARTSAGVPDTLFHDLLRMVQVERERTLALESEIRLLQKAEVSMQTRIQVLEERFASSCKDSMATKDSRKD